MPAAPIPANDAFRLSTLDEVLILHTPPEAAFDAIVREAAEVAHPHDPAVVANPCTLSRRVSEALQRRKAHRRVQLFEMAQ